MNGACKEDGGAPVTVIVGIQWGDEGKGRVVDMLAADADVVARFGGGDNAGHTLVVGDRRLALRIVPSGALEKRPELFVGSGTVVSLASLEDEIATLAQIGVDVSRIKVSDRAHVVFPYHQEAAARAKPPAEARRSARRAAESARPMSTKPRAPGSRLPICAIRRRFPENCAASAPMNP